MPPKRPAALSDAALGHKAGAAAIGETNAGAPLPVKNTFIDVPSGCSPKNSRTAAGLSTAPAQTTDPGFIRTVLESVNESASGGAGDLQGWKPPPAVQRPPPSSGGVQGLSDLPLMTPSPTGSSMFSAARYQLFGGPAPVQEAATHSAFPGGPGCPPGMPAPLPGGAPLLSVHPPQGPPLLSSHPPAQGLAMPLSHAALPTAGAAMAGVPGARPGAPLKPGAAARDKDGSDDEDADSEAERQNQAYQALLASGRTPENAPKPPPGAAHPSLGSAGHEDATCKRCCFFPRNRCLNGYECEFCHYEHEKRKRKNKKSKKKKAADGQGEEEYAQQLHHAGVPRHLHHAPPPMADPTLTYQWTDGIPGQVPPPPPMPGYGEWLAALPPLQHRAEPALATNGPPPQAQPPYLPPQPPPPHHYDPYRAAYPPQPQLSYPPYPGHHVPGLEPAWPYYGADLGPSYGAGARMSYPPPATAQAPEAAAAAASGAAAADAVDPTPPPPMCSPKLPKDIMDSLQEGAPFAEAAASANG
eukprot:gb/GFBE01078398.1/.p1 GENE.gb/GFBE01078398.1/~~gb/GFBE01078398.1/.p1  ORF type:complete len:527 (+),score=53.97 gb/GFBE01078398.1/:1-1581(+)